jgi:hypothetical protein
MKLGTFRKFIWMFIVGLSAFSIVHAAPPKWRAVDAGTFDIAGVKLGMSHDQALVAAANHFKLNPEVLKKKTSIKSSELVVVKSAKDVMNKPKVPAYFDYENDGEKLLVYFTERVPVDKADSVAVYKIEYYIRSTEENNAALKEAALKKYGVQSCITYMDQLMWCAKRNPHSEYCEQQQAVLSLGGSYLKLEAPLYKKEREDYFNELNKKKPNF